MMTVRRLQVDQCARYAAAEIEADEYLMSLYEKDRDKALDIAVSRAIERQRETIRILQDLGDDDRRDFVRSMAQNIYGRIHIAQSVKWLS